MKSFIAGLLAFLIIGLLAFNSLRDRGILDLNPSPSPSPETIVGNWDMEPSTDIDVNPSPTPTPPSTPKPEVAGTTTTKGGNVLGSTTKTPAPKPASTTKTTTTTTTTTTKITKIKILESSDCQLDATSIIRDIDSPLTVKYWVKDGYTATVTAWTTIGEEVKAQTLIQGSGVLFEYKGSEDLKLQVVSKSCVETTDTWLSLTAEK